MRENVARLLWDARVAGRGGPVAVERRWRARLAAMVAHAREGSLYYRELYGAYRSRSRIPLCFPRPVRRS